MLANSVHIHDVQARKLDLNGAPATPGEMGLKDTVVGALNERARLDDRVTTG